MQILGIDIGGTGIKYGIVDTVSGTLIGDKGRIATPRPATPDAVGAVLAGIVAEFAWRGPVGIGFPAAIVNGTVRTAANIDKSFLGLPIAAHFAQHTGCPVFVANDADAAGLAEMRFGAGRGRDGVAIMVTLGTGIGSAVFVDGNLVPNTELGHLEFKGQVAEHHAAAAVRKAQHLTWEQWGRRVGHYLTMLTTLFSPELIVVGGGVSRKFDRFADEIAALVPTNTEVVPAALQNRAGIVGAALVAAGDR